ncbi:fumarate hydratase [Psychrilyobacter sp.]|uniref:fumarate hydratase n=1 Tax=Psychrilyobacter sp. TaxID=2586924 RepID=UPI0030171BB6
MKNLDLNKVTNAVEKMCMEANFYLGSDVLDNIKRIAKTEASPVGKNILNQIITNHEIAQENQVPMCQDTGIVVVFLEIGTEVYIDGDIYEAVNEGIRRGYKKGFLRNSVVKDPLDRVNTKDNTPGIIHMKLVPGSDKVKIIVAPKGGGSENMSAIRMLKPADGIEGIKEFVVETIKKAGGNPCPPIIVGVGIGGSFEKAALLAKESLMRDVNDSSSNPINAKLEDELLELVNKTGVGPMGLGGRNTALSVKVETYPCHIASLPVAININCHAARHKEIIL